VLTLLALAVVVVLVVYGWSSLILNREYEAEERHVLLSSRPDVLVRGERLSQVFGCYRGCHGPELEGSVFVDEWAIGRIVAPNLTHAVRNRSTTELEAIIRQGVYPEGRSAFGMPSGGFAVMTDRDLSAVLSFIKQQPEKESDLGHSHFGPLARLGLVLGEYQPSAIEVQQAPWTDVKEDNPFEHGKYIALNACSECHGLEFEGAEGFTPPLSIAKGYSIEEFTLLMSEGIGLGGRDLGLMSKMGQNRFSQMTPVEVEALYASLQAF